MAERLNALLLEPYLAGMKSQLKVCGWTLTGNLQECKNIFLQDWTIVKALAALFKITCGF